MQKAIKKVSSRILTFDLLRGYFLIVILFNHLQYYPSGLDIFTGRGMLYVSSAEGFFAVSGIILGIVRGRKLLDKPMRVAAKLLFKRSFQLYAASIILTLLFTVIGWYFMGSPGLKVGVYPTWTNPWDLIWQTITLQYTYGWADFLRYYALFIFATPFALWLLRKGYWYIVVALSFIVWLLYPYSPFPANHSQPISWQVIFFGGFIIGYYWPIIVAKWRNLAIQTRTWIGMSFAITTAVTMLASVVLVFGHEIGGSIGATLDSIHHVVERGFHKDRMSIPRVLLGVVWFWGLFWVFRRFEATIVKRLGWLLLPFGENSLYVYIIEAFVVFFFHLFLLTPGQPHGVGINLVVSLAALSLVWIAVRTKFLMKIIPR